MTSSALSRVDLFDRAEVSLVEIASLQPTDASLRNGHGILCQEPIEVLQTLDGRKLITDGHHRAYGHYAAYATHIRALVRPADYYDASSSLQD